MAIDATSGIPAAVVAIVGDTHQKPVVALVQGIAHVHTETDVAIGIEMQFLAVHVDFRLVIGTLEVKYLTAMAVPFALHRKAFGIPTLATHGESCLVAADAGCGERAHNGSACSLGSLGLHTPVVGKVQQAPATGHVGLGDGSTSIAITEPPVAVDAGCSLIGGCLTNDDSLLGAVLSHCHQCRQPTESKNA